MKVLRENIEYQGTPEEIATLFELIEPRVVTTDENLPVFTPDDFEPVENLENTVSESEQLRRKLAEDANYNPFGGVVPSKESESEAAQTNMFTAEQDTGVELK